MTAPRQDLRVSVSPRPLLCEAQRSLLCEARYAGRSRVATQSRVRVFLAGIIQGSIVQKKIHDQNWREAIKAILARRLPAAEVYCHYARHPNSIAYDLRRLRATLAEGNRLAGECEVLVAYVPSASMGTAVEMYEAARGGAVVLTISPLKANWVIRAYSDRVFADLAKFEAFLQTPAFRRLLGRKAKALSRREQSS